MAERFIGINPDNLEAGEFYAVFTDKDNATLTIKKDIQDAVNADVETLKTTQNAIVLDVTNAKEDILALEGDNVTNKSNISSLQTDNALNKSDISDLISDNSTNKSNISNLQSEVAINTSDITTLKTDNTTNKSDIATLKTQVEGIDPSPVAQCWVSQSGGLDTNNGGISKPFRTIQKALNEGFKVVNVLGGTYTENITIPTAYGLYGVVIAGTGAFESPNCEIHGTVTIPANVSRVRFKNILLDGDLLGPAIIDNGSLGRHVLENVTVSNPASGGDLIRVVNGSNWWNIEGSTIEGIVNLSGTGNNMTFNIMNSPGSYLNTPIVNNGYTFTAFNVGKMGLITHLGGNVVCSYIGSWYPVNSKIINSTSTNPLDFIGVGYSNFTADVVNYGTISSTGATVVKNNNVEGTYSDVCLSAISTVASTLITTTASTLIAGTKKVERNISYNTSNGELTFTKTGSYNITAVIKIDCTEWNKKVETWIEKWNGTSWDVVSDTGMQRMFQTDQEVEINYHFSSYFTAGEKYRIRAVSDSDTTLSAKTITLANNVKMPAMRISVFA